MLNNLNGNQLYALTQKAEQEVGIYRSANIAEWVAAIDPVLRAAGLPTIGSDTVDDIQLSKIGLTIRTSYSVMCCAQSDTIRLPVEILTASNPSLAAKRYKLIIELNQAKQGLAKAQQALSHYTAKVKMVEAALVALNIENQTQGD